MFLGHLAIPILLNYYGQGDTEPLFAATLFPDIVDKSLQQVGMARNGRTLAHTLFSLTLSTFVVKLIWNKATAKSWMLGYLGHLLCDAGGTIPWLYPLAAYDFEPSSRDLWQKIKHGATNISLVESILLIWAISIIRRHDVRKKL